MAVLATQSVSRSGLSVSYAAATSGGDKVSPGDHVFLHVKNAGGSVCNVTITTPGTFDGQAISDVTVAVPATTGDKLIGPITAELFRASDGYAAVTYDQVSSVTVAAVSV
jgi:hypothetical protein